jgi:hypothetical protein
VFDTGLYLAVSGVQVRYLKVIEKSGYQALPWVRYITRQGRVSDMRRQVIHRVWKTNPSLLIQVPAGYQALPWVRYITRRGTVRHAASCQLLRFEPSSLEFIDTL